MRPIIVGTKFGIRSDKGILRQHVVCKCICGTNFIVGINNYPLTKSCGCMNKSRIHGSCNTTTYKTWKGMIQRCNNEKASNYPYYGGLGIKVCDQWMTFPNFLRDMGIKPKNKTLDRIDGSLGYCKENCKWSTKKEQARNRSNGRILTIDGISKTVSEWAENSGAVTELCIRGRLYRGWTSHEEIVFKKDNRKKR